jgi:O-antigen/teichoic acid export membrane protein
VSKKGGVLPAASFTVVTRLVVLASGFALSILTARGLGVEGRGQYYALVTLGTILAQFGNLGLSSSNTFLAARDRSQSWPLMVNSVWVAGALGLLVAILVALFGDQVAGRLGMPAGMCWMLCLLAPALLVVTLGSSLLVANERFVSVNGWSVANALLIFMAASISLAVDSGAEALVTVTVGAAVLVAFGMVIDIRRLRGGRAGWRFDAPSMRAGIQFASRAYLALLCGFLIQRIGVALVATYRDVAEIGVYSIAAQIADVLVIVPTSMALVIFPMLVRDPVSAWPKTRSALWLVMLIMGVASLGTWLFGEWAISLVFGESFSSSAQVLLWMQPSILAIAITSILSQYVVAEGFPRSLAALWVGGLAVTILSGIPLVGRYGANGAAMAQSVSSVFVLIGVLALTLRRIRTAPTARQSG